MGTSKTEKRSFEQKLERLDAIVRALEKGETPLEQSLALYTEGAELISQCSSELDRAEQTVVKLRKGQDGVPVEEDFIMESDRDDT